MLPQTLLELREATRDRLNDHGKVKPKWSDATIDRALNEAEREACERARLLRDEFTDAITKIEATAAVAAYLLHPSIFEIDGAYNETDGRVLTEASEPELYQQDSQWRTRTGSNTCEYVVQALPNERLRLLLVPVPSVAATIRLQVYRYPRYTMTSNGDEPEIGAQHHDGLVEWAVYRCFSVKDPDLYDPQKAADAQAEFTKLFGIKIDANIRRRLREKRTNVAVARDF